MRRMRTDTSALPTEVAVNQGLSYSLWLPAGQPGVKGGVLILHGAGSCKESHHDYARFVLAAGYAALVFDQRGHGASQGPMDGRALQDIATMATLLRSRIEAPHPALALRGSSMGGYFAIAAASLTEASAVVAICPASAEGLRRALIAGRMNFSADVPALERLLSTEELVDTVRTLRMPLLLLHAEGDEQVPVQHSRELAEHLSAPGSRLITVPGGHHRSVQHDPELQAVSLRFIDKALAS